MISNLQNIIGLYMRQNSDDQYLIELPNLQYVRSDILYIAESLSSYWSRWQDPVSGNVSVVPFDELWYTPLIDMPEIQKLMSQLTPKLNLVKPPIFFSRLNPNFDFAAHIDRSRTAVLIVPVVPDVPAPIFWVDENGIELKSHTYRCATIINPKILHGVRKDNRERIHLQISINVPWETILNMKDSLLTPLQL